MATKVSLINVKGGVGKSTLTINLAWHFAAYEDWNKKVLVIDLDPQFNASVLLLSEHIAACNDPGVDPLCTDHTVTAHNIPRIAFAP